MVGALWGVTGTIAGGLEGIQRGQVGQRRGLEPRGREAEP